MTTPDLSRATWHKSTHSSQDGNCVEVARNLPGLIAIRDSKHPAGTTLTVPQEAWTHFTRRLHPGPTN